ncbi:MAG: CoA pyrophosphatase [Shewanella sp.]
MDVAEFRLRFNLQPLAKVESAARPHPSLRKAAVLIGLHQLNGELQVILTQRPQHLRAHPGQISFPGGKIEASDPNAIGTALREAEEEIGLMRHNVEVLGTFPAHHTFTGFDITPVVGLIKHPFDLILDPGEVAECFTLPLSYVMEPQHRNRNHCLRQGRYYPVHFIHYEQRLIWGATAAMLDHLCRHLTPTASI